MGWIVSPPRPSPPPPVHSVPQTGTGFGDTVFEEVIQLGWAPIWRDWGPHKKRSAHTRTGVQGPVSEKTLSTSQGERPQKKRNLSTPGSLIECVFHFFFFFWNVVLTHNTVKFHIFWLLFYSYLLKSPHFPHFLLPFPLRAGHLTAVIFYHQPPWLDISI